MKSATRIATVFDSGLFSKTYLETDHPEAPAALPDASLDFLLNLASDLEVTNIFEFGSGRSTLAFLEAGFSVVSLEDSDFWMEKTVAAIPENYKTRHTPLVRPLRLRFHGAIPVKDWEIDDPLKAILENANLILVDSPYFTPFREATLWSALIHGKNAVVVLDDTRIPTVNAFCDRLVAENSDLLHRRVRVGHCFDEFWRPPASSLRFHHSILDVAKGWRRFLLAKKLLGKQT